MMPPMRREAAAVVLMQDLNLEAFWLQSRQQVHACVVARGKGWTTWHIISTFYWMFVRHAALFVVLLIISSPGLVWYWSQRVPHGTGYRTSNWKATDDTLVNCRCK